MSTRASIEPGTWALVTVFFLTDALRVTPRWTTPPSCERRSQVQRRQAGEGASCALFWEAFCPSSSSQTRVFVEVAKAKSESKRVRCGWGHKHGGERALKETAAVYQIRSDARHRRQQSRRLRARRELPCRPTSPSWVAELKMKELLMVEIPRTHSANSC